jgi:hypothetical protein
VRGHADRSDPARDTGSTLRACECDNRRESRKIKLTSVYVDDQGKALRFYTEVLGFVKLEAFDQ